MTISVTYCSVHGLYTGERDQCPGCLEFAVAHRRPKPLTGKDVFRAPATADEYPHIDNPYRAALRTLGNPMPEDQPILPVNAAVRKGIPLTTGLLDYFPRALLAIAELSRIGNDQHNPGQPLHWSREKSSDHPDCLLRHMVDRGAIDIDGVRHSTKVGWRALALLELELEAAEKEAAECLKAQP